jgi:GNAT superfamily N-acetyltransferase
MADHRFELHEMSVWSQIQGMAAADFREHFGISLLHDRGGLRIRAHRTRDLSLNRVYGLGIETPLTAEGLDRLIEEYKQAGASRFMVSWAPVCRPEDAGHWFLERGFRRIPSVVRLTRRTDLHVHPASDLRVVEATVADTERFGELAARCNELPPEYAPGLNSTIGRPGWRHYFVLDGDRAIAAGALYVEGDVAWAGLGGTLPEDRRRGAQTALLARRVRDARADGARWITSWTTAESADRPNQSLRNMKRLGFEVSYELQNFVLDLRPS